MRRRSMLAGFGLLGLATGPVAAATPQELAGPMAAYRRYVLDEAGRLVEATRVFVAAIQAGDLPRARALYAPTRVPWERIEPVAELFEDLDTAIDSRADDHAEAEKDPAFLGFHRIEHALFALGTTEGLAPVADRLLADVQTLRARLEGLEMPPGKVVGGAAALMEEVASTKISGEENRYSGTDLSDFQANVDGARTIVGFVRPLVRRADAALLEEMDRHFGRVDAILARYRRGDGFESYDRLSPADRNGLQGPVTALAEQLSRLRGLLKLD